MTQDSTPDFNPFSRHRPTRATAWPPRHPRSNNQTTQRGTRVLPERCLALSEMDQEQEYHTFEWRGGGMNKDEWARASNAKEIRLICTMLA